MEVVQGASEELNYSLDESLIELQQIITCSEQREIHLGWQRILDRPIEVHRLQESSNRTSPTFLGRVPCLGANRAPGSDANSRSW